MYSFLNLFRLDILNDHTVEYVTNFLKYIWKIYSKTVFFQDLDDPTKFAMLESWDTVEDLAAHTKQPHVAAFKEAMLPLKGAAEPEVKKYKSCGH